MSLEIKSHTLKRQISLAEQTPSEELSIITEMKSIGVENLPYSYSSLRKFIDPETMEVHYNRHYKGYVKNLNNALKKLEEKDLDLEKIVKNISKYNTTIRNNAGGAFNHALFWKMLTPTKQSVHGEILKRIRKDFGSYENFKNKFVNSATRKFGSGWCWLVLTKRNTLKIVCTSNQDNPLMNIIQNGGYPLLGLDLWEHAYYLKYKNKRDEYINNFWKVVNWEFVNKLLSDQLERTKDNKEKKPIKESKIILEENSVSPCTGPRFKNTVYSKLSLQQRKLYAKTINEVLKTKYKDNWVDLGNPENLPSGFYNIENEGRSVLSYANTNYSLMCFLVLLMSKIAKQKGWEPIKFNTDDKDLFNKNYSRFLGMLKAFSNTIMDGWVLDNIWSILESKRDKGNKTEGNFSDVVNKKSEGRIKIELVSGLGSILDLQGTDGYVDRGRGQETIQIKPFSKWWEDEEGYINIEGSAAVKEYNTDLMGFISKQNEVLIFETPGMDISKGLYRFPKENKVEL